MDHRPIPKPLSTLGDYTVADIGDYSRLVWTMLNFS